MGDVIPIGTITVEEAATEVVTAFREHLSPNLRPQVATAHKVALTLAEVVIMAQGNSAVYRLLDFVPLAKMTAELQWLGSQLINLSALEQCIMDLLTGVPDYNVQSLIYKTENAMPKLANPNMHVVSTPA